MNIEKNTEITEKRREKLEKELLRIKDLLIKTGVEKIILFGSFAKGKVGRTTDIDLLVVKDTDQTFSQRLKQIYDAVVPKMSADILVYTQEELNDMSKWSTFVKRILREGKVLYAK